MLTFFPALVLLAPQAAEPKPVPARIREVTVYGSSAMVRREADVAGSGTWVLAGLPRAIDAENVRVRCTGGEVVSVDVRERLQEAVPSERLQRLRDRLRELERGLRELADERQLAKDVESHLKELLQQEAEVHRREVAEGRPSPEAWAASLDFVTQRLTDVRAALRDVGRRIELQEEEIKKLQAELGELQQKGTVPVYDVAVEVLAQGGRAQLELDTFVQGTGWAPVYDLRAASDLSGVELVYRARVWQQTGEDWNDVELLLSTARPQMGAQGPEPPLVWLDLYDPKSGAGRVLSSRAPAAELRTAADAAAPAATPAFTAVEQEGLSVRFRLPRRETIESRQDPTTVLVGRAPLAIQPERFCVPAVDTTVWLRAKATNTSEWTLLPGRAAVFFGEDFLGHAEVETVQPGQEIELHLGADPGITVERTQIEDQEKKPGFLSSRSSKVERWRVRFENHGTVGTAPDGSATVFMREALPRSRDDRVAVELSQARPSPSSDERWKEDREEKSIYTWVLSIPKGGAVDVTFEVTIAYPNGLEVVRRW